MARAATTADVFNAIAEPRRSTIINILAKGDQGVGQLMARLQIAQPAVSKHLGVLRKVGLVSVRKEGRRRLYRLNAKELKSVHDWAKRFEEFWTHQLDRIRERAQKEVRERADSPRHPPPKTGAT
jgi:DNA-binding transcriptional ArsR family regulator